MKNLLLFTFICSLFISCASGDNNQMAETIINSTENKIVLLEIPSELTYLSDDEQYGNFEIPVPEITEDVYIGNIRSITIESPGAAIVVIQEWPKIEFQYRTLKEYAYSISDEAENEIPFGSISKNSFKDIETSILSGEIKGIRETFTMSAFSEDIPHIRDTFLIKSKNNIVILLTQVATEDYKMVEPGFANVLNSFNLK